MGEAPRGRRKDLMQESNEQLRLKVELNPPHAIIDLRDLTHMLSERNAKWIPGWEGDYAVSDDGVVFSLKTRKLKILEQTQNLRSGYFYVTLCRDSRSRKEYVHRLVLKAFSGVFQSGQVTRHLNGRHWDNRLANLEVGTQKENSADAKRHGTIWSKISPAAVVAIREAYAANDVTQEQLARRFGLTQPQIGNIARGNHWPEVGGPITRKGKGRKKIKENDL